MYHRVQCETAWGFPDVTLREEKPCARVFSLLMLHIGKMGMWPGEGCEAGRQFPDVTHKDLKSVWEGVFLPDVSDEEENVRRSAIWFLM